MFSDIFSAPSPVAEQGLSIKSKQQKGERGICAGNWSPAHSLGAAEERARQSERAAEDAEATAREHSAPRAPRAPQSSPRGRHTEDDECEASEDHFPYGPGALGLGDPGLDALD